jgi:anthranilate phosphoribosyltransferase
VVGGRAEGFVEAVRVAQDSIDSGAAADVLERVVERSRSMAA